MTNANQNKVGAAVLITKPTSRDKHNHQCERGIFHNDKRISFTDMTSLKDTHK